MQAQGGRGVEECVSLRPERDGAKRAADHAQRAEHRQGIVEGLVRKAPEPAEIGLHSQGFDPKLGSL